MEQTVPLADGARIPRIGFGTWQLTRRSAYDSVRCALQAGYRHIDTATMYGNEAEIGRALRDSAVPREEVFLTTKLPPERAKRARQTLEQSLTGLGVSNVDLWLIHWPTPAAQLVATWEALLAARAEGLARSVGVSNFSTAQLDRLLKETGEMPVLNQIPWSLPEHSPKVLAEHRERGVVLEGYSPLKRSDLRSPALADIAAAHGVSPAQVVLRWHLQHDIVIIPKSATPARIEENLNLYGFSLTDAEMSTLDGLS
jgi:diketogulonate reductase-like aldo/keto reductase